MTLNDGSYDGRDGIDRRTAAILLLLLLFLLFLAAWIWHDSSPRRTPADGSFRTTFEGCDRRGRCADFRILAPGYDYRWGLASVTMDPVNGREPDLASVIGDELRGAQAVIAAGLASREGGDAINRQLSACRSKRLSALIDGVQARIGTNARTYRISLGRYQDAPIQVGGTADPDTSIERLVVMAFVLDFDQGININEALKEGLLKALPSALRSALGPIRRQLDFTRYACWNNEFEVTLANRVRQTCYREPSGNPAVYCGSF